MNDNITVLQEKIPDLSFTNRISEIFLKSMDII